MGKAHGKLEHAYQHRQRRTDFLGIVGQVKRGQVNHCNLAVNGGRISQVLWGESIIEWLCWNDPRQRRTDFLSIVGTLMRSYTLALFPVNVGRIS